VHDEKLKQLMSGYGMNFKDLKEIFERFLLWMLLMRKLFENDHKIQLHDHHNIISTTTPKRNITQSQLKILGEFLRRTK
jgi:hypothetical protein